MGPIIILDKSTFQSLSKDEHLFLHMHFMENLTPILGMEILGDLRKEAPGTKSAEQKLSELADKFGGSGPATNVDYRSLCFESLLGNHFPLDGRIIPESSRAVHDPKMGRGMIIDLSPLNRAILRWQDGKFEEFEREFSTYWRQVTLNLDLDSFGDQLNAYHVILPRVDNFRELRETVDTLLADVAHQEIWLSWLLGQLSPPPDIEALLLARWRASRIMLMKHFSPFSFHCLRALLMLLVGTRHRLIRWQPTNLIDVQYLYYLPFCMVFASNDRLHHNLAPLLIRENQSYVPGIELKADLRRIADFKDSLDNLKGRKLAYALGSYPPPRKDSVVYQLWKKFMHPWRRGRGNLVTNLSEGECEDALSWVKQMFIDVEGEAYFKDTKGKSS